MVYKIVAAAHTGEAFRNSESPSGEDSSLDEELALALAISASEAEATGDVKAGVVSDIAAAQQEKPSGKEFRVNFFPKGLVASHYFRLDNSGRTQSLPDLSTHAKAKYAIHSDDRGYRLVGMSPSPSLKGLGSEGAAPFVWKKNEGPVDFRYLAPPLQRLDRYAKEKASRECAQLNSLEIQHLGLSEYLTCRSSFQWTQFVVRNLDKASPEMLAKIVAYLAVVGKVRNVDVHLQSTPRQLVVKVGTTTGILALISPESDWHFGTSREEFNQGARESLLMRKYSQVFSAEDAPFSAALAQRDSVRIQVDERGVWPQDVFNTLFKEISSFNQLKAVFEKRPDLRGPFVRSYLVYQGMPKMFSFIEELFFSHFRSLWREAEKRESGSSRRLGATVWDQLAPEEKMFCIASLSSGRNADLSSCVPPAIANMVDEMRQEFTRVPLVSVSDEGKVLVRIRTMRSWAEFASGGAYNVEAIWLTAKACRGALENVAAESRQAESLFITGIDAPFGIYPLAGGGWPYLRERSVMKTDATGKPELDWAGRAYETYRENGVCLAIAVRREDRIHLEAPEMKYIDIPADSTETLSEVVRAHQADTRFLGLSGFLFENTFATRPALEALAWLSYVQGPTIDVYTPKPLLSLSRSSSASSRGTEGNGATSPTGLLPTAQEPEAIMVKPEDFPSGPSLPKRSPEDALIKSPRARVPARLTPASSLPEQFVTTSSIHLGEPGSGMRTASGQLSSPLQKRLVAGAPTLPHLQGSGQPNSAAALTSPRVAPRRPSATPGGSAFSPKGSAVTAGGTGKRASTTATDAIAAARYEVERVQIQYGSYNATLKRSNMNVGTVSVDANDTAGDVLARVNSDRPAGGKYVSVSVKGPALSSGTAKLDGSEKVLAALGKKPGSTLVLNF